MPNRLPIPKELQHLIEKRQTETRRQKQRRETETAEVADQERSSGDGSKTAQVEVTDDVSARRKKTDRRQAGRRKTDG